MAHGYARVTGKPMAVALHANVGLMHATMAIFNAWCDRIPILMLGGIGPMDAVQRRPWVDWIHTSRDIGSLIRDYTKWDDLPGSVPAALESMLRAWQIMMTPPQGPVYVCLDASIQEQVVAGTHALPVLARFRPASPAEPSAEVVAKVAEALATAKRPLLLMGRVSGEAQDWDHRVALAERLNARVLTDLKTGARFPTRHPLHPYAPGIFVSGDAGNLIREADVIVSLDWVDLAGALRVACGGEWPEATIIQCSLDQYLHNGWSMDYQALPPADISILASPDVLVTRLLAAIPADSRRPSFDGMPKPAVAAPREAEAAPGGLSIEDMARASTELLAAHNPSYIRLPIGWPGHDCNFAHPPVKSR
jgi:thiamine pyrophosphate-dependent acetolactate synthase large subunit-like protein